MYKRTSIINNINTLAATISSMIEIGDSSYIHGISRALAVQREQQLFFGQEGQFAHYDIFSKPFPDEPITEQVNFESTPLKPFIKVGNIDITAISSSSILHTGSSRNVSLEARVKHIRHLREEK